MCDRNRRGKTEGVGPTVRGQRRLKEESGWKKH